MSPDDPNRPIRRQNCGDMYSGEPLEDGEQSCETRHTPLDQVKGMTMNVAVRGGNDCCTNSLHAYCCLNTVGGSKHILLIITRNCTKSRNLHLRLIFSFTLQEQVFYLGITLTLTFPNQNRWNAVTLGLKENQPPHSPTTSALYLWKPWQCMLMLKSVSKEPWQENCCYDEGAYHAPPVRKLSYDEVDFVEFAW